MIVILGSGRSGTTFLAKLFDSHPAVLYRHEPDSILRDLELPYLPPAEVPDAMAERAGRYLQELVQVRHPKTAAMPLFPKAYRGAVRQRLHGGATMGLKALARAAGPLLARHLRLPDLIGGGAGVKFTPVIKSVDSLGRAQAFLKSDPEVRIVHILRHPCGVFASVMRGVEQNLMKPEPYLDSVFAMAGTENYGFTRETMGASSFEEQIVFYWMVTNDKALLELEGHPRYATVIYEDLCLDPAREMRRLFDFARLDWNEATTRFIDDLPQHDQDQGRIRYFSVMRPLRSALERWKTDLKEDQVVRIRGVVERGAVARFFPDLTPACAGNQGRWEEATS